MRRENFRQRNIHDGNDHTRAQSCQSDPVDPQRNKIEKDHDQSEPYDLIDDISHPLDVRPVRHKGRRSEYRSDQLQDIGAENKRKRQFDVKPDRSGNFKKCIQIRNDDGSDHTQYPRHGKIGNDQAVKILVRALIIIVIISRRDKPCRYRIKHTGQNACVRSEIVGKSDKAIGFRSDP